MMINAITKKEYTGTNQANLQGAGFSDNRFLTFVQAKGLGRQVKKGSKGIRLMTVLEKERKNKITGKVEKKKTPFYFTVFNFSQTKEYVAVDA
jgi:antirestriction protein ArdC